MVHSQWVNIKPKLGQAGRHCCFQIAFATVSCRTGPSALPTTCLVLNLLCVLLHIRLVRLLLSMASHEVAGEVMFIKLARGPILAALQRETYVCWTGRSESNLEGALQERGCLLEAQWQLFSSESQQK